MRASSWLVAGLAGLLFAAGLVLGGMTQPARIVGFLDVTGSWDPTLLFVMAGAVGVHLPLLSWLRRKGQPWFAPNLRLPRRSDVDPRLLIGSALFGFGWGLGGYCPGPGLMAVVTGHSSALLFVASMLLGMALHEGFVARRRSTPRTADPSASTTA